LFPSDVLHISHHSRPTIGGQASTGNEGQAFRLESGAGLELVLTKPLDRELRAAYSLVLEAYDGGSPPRRSQMTLDVSVLDVNDNAPVFNQSRYVAYLPENLPAGASVLQVFASDADEGPNGQVIYRINRRQSDPGHCFTIDGATGVIRLEKALDYEVRKVHELVVEARDNDSKSTVQTLHCDTDPPPTHSP
uniref:Cadherin domain-containing protein n=1 Tax=Callorhinchus milii TaxID=7868 RepID=A0A4W3GZK6_CALMI